METEQKIELLYSPAPTKPMNVVAFGSGTGSNLEALIEAQKDLYSIKAIFCDRKCRCLEIGDHNGIPTIYLSFKRYFKEKGVTDKTDLQTRFSYEDQVIYLLSQLNVTTDIIFLAGYMRLVHKPLLEAFPNRILNVHPADLTILDEKRHRQYVGVDGVSDALNAGETSTRSSVFIVDDNIDTGQLLVLGPSVNYTEGYPLTEEKIKVHHEKQKQYSDWIASVEALKLIAEGRIGLNQNGNVVIDNNEGYHICAGSSQLLTTNQ
ncbi:MAG: Phosphoribosylglycinamide formyltransferase [Chlamydiae bacterium]|nr:Phosphoribosylglycinamide formyltransferase [Chlamydiota bacterium]